MEFVEPVVPLLLLVFCITREPGTWLCKKTLTDFCNSSVAVPFNVVWWSEEASGVTLCDHHEQVWS